MDYTQLTSNIARYRKACGLTQDQLAERVGVSAQAVSKWENGQSYPDIATLPKLADIFDVSMDDLFSKPVTAETVYVPEEERKPSDEMLLRIRVNSSEGDHVNVNLPLTLVKVFVNAGLDLSDKEMGVKIGGNDVMKSIDFDLIFKMIDEGVVGKLVDIESADGDVIEIYVE
ncbi:MAG: helix-turn-helix domain-containing protein [Saccharofermentanales bacterium]|jgi:transcriptional regulator with XRE-family HTH domain